MERIDALHIKNMFLVQDDECFCFGVDAVLLADFASKTKSAKTLDLCSGNGIIPILMSAKNSFTHFTGLEIQQKNVLMAKKSIEINELTQRIDIICDDLKNCQNLFNLHSFDKVTCNPPYKLPDSGLKNPNESLAISRHELLCTLEDVIFATEKMLNSNGRAYFIHRPERIADIIVLLKQYKLEPKKIRFVCSKANCAPTMVLIEAMKGAKSGLKVMPVLCIYNNDGTYSDEINQIYDKS